MEQRQLNLVLVSTDCKGSQHVASGAADEELRADWHGTSTVRMLMQSAVIDDDDGVDAASAANRAEG